MSEVAQARRLGLVTTCSAVDIEAALRWHEITVSDREFLVVYDMQMALGLSASAHAIVGVLKRWRWAA